MVGSTTWVLLEIYLAFQQWKNFENPLRIDKVIAMSSVCSFFGPPCTSWSYGLVDDVDEFLCTSNGRPAVQSFDVCLIIRRRSLKVTKESEQVAI